MNSSLQNHYCDADFTISNHDVAARTMALQAFDGAPAQNPPHAQSIVCERGDGISSIEGAAGTVASTRERILLVEDDGEIQLMLRHALARLGYVVQVAGNGRKALEVWQGADASTRPQLILTDVRMPDMNGIELLRA
ncbi:MAG TPA: response regulator, partial [Abditibacteriaceae bacterium]